MDERGTGSPETRPTDPLGDPLGRAIARLTERSADQALRDKSFPIHWKVTLANVLTHETDSTIVTLD